MGFPCPFIQPPPFDPANVVISGGSLTGVTINNSVIGGTTAAAATATVLTANTRLALADGGTFDAVAASISIAQYATRQLGIRIGSDGQIFEFDGLRLALGSGLSFAWNAAATFPITSIDTNISRVSAGLIGVGTGAAGSVAGALRAATFSTSVPVTETGTTHTVAATTSHLITNNAGAVTVTLPAAASFPGRHLWIRAITNGTVVSASSNVVPRAGGAAGTAIIGAVDGGWVLLVSDGTNWENMAGS